MSALQDRLQQDLTTAIRARDEISTATLRMALTGVKNEAVAGKVARVLTDEDVTRVLVREGKMRRESAAAYDDAGRPELADRERAELDVLARYLPAPLAATELDALVRDAVAVAASGGAEGMRAMGAVMKVLTPQVAGRADGAQVAAAVKAALGV